MLDFRARTGSLELVSVDRIERTHLEFRVRQKASSNTAVGELDLTDTVPAQVVRFNFMGLRAK
jgi:hypothetical protein